MMRNFVTGGIIVLALLAGWGLSQRGHWSLLSSSNAAVVAGAAPHGRTPTVTSLEDEITRLRGLMPPQSVAMLSVAQQFSQLSTAAKRRNWPLATFFLEETAETIEWAVRLEPIRQDPSGVRIDLAAIFDSLEGSIIPELKAAIEAKNPERFDVAYAHMVQGCYSCHKAVGKPYLRPRVPTNAEDRGILNFDPEAAWPL